MRFLLTFIFLFSFVALLMGQFLSQSEFDKTYKELGPIKNIIQLDKDHLLGVGEKKIRAKAKDVYLAKFTLNGTFINSEFRTIGGEKDEGVNAMALTAEGGYALVGYTKSAGEGKKDAWIAILDQDKIFNNTDESFVEATFGFREDDELFDVMLAQNGLLIMTGKVRETLSVITFDGHDFKQYNCLECTGISAGKAIIESKDGRLLITGYQESENQTNLMVWTFDMEQKSFQEIFSQEHAIGIDIVETADEQAVLVIGNRSDQGFGNDFLALKIGRENEVLINYNIENKGSGTLKKIIPLSNGNFLLIGSSNAYNPWAAGAALWAARLNEVKGAFKLEVSGLFGDRLGGGNNVIKLKDSNQLIVGGYSSSGKIRGRLVKFNLAGFTEPMRAEPMEIDYEFPWKYPHSHSGLEKTMTISFRIRSQNLLQERYDDGRSCCFIKLADNSIDEREKGIVRPLDFRILDDNVKPYQYRISQEVELRVGTNQYELKIEDIDGNKLFNSGIEIVHQAVPPKLHLLSIGILYSDSAYQLKYTTNDAQDFFTQYQTLISGKPYKEIHSVLKATNNETENGEIIRAVETLKNNYDKGLIDTSDVIMIFISGHGEPYSVNGQKGSLRILGSGVRQGHHVSSAIDFEDLLEIIRPINCKRIIFLDACYSGISVEDKSPGERFEDMEGVISAIADQQPGICIIASSRENEVSKENDHWKHGVFTQAILDAFSDEAVLIDQNISIRANQESGRGIVDEVLTIGELFEFLKKRVPYLSKKVQNPTISNYEKFKDFPIYYFIKD